MRIKAIDSIRGFAVLLLFMVNIPIWTTAIIQNVPDLIAEMLRAALLDGWLYMAFACMFGAAIILANDSPKQFYRRMMILFAIGMIHGILLNYMDILAVYAVLGVWSFSFRKSSEKRLFFYGLGFLFVPIAVYSLLAFFAPQLVRYSEQNPIGFLERASLWFPMLISQIIFHSWEIMGMMLLGMAMVKAEFFNEDKFTKLKTLLVVALPIAIVLMLAYSYFKPIGEERITLIIYNEGRPLKAIFKHGNAALTAIFYFIGAPLLSLGVISIVTKFKINFFASLGQISLSLYFMQSVWGVVMFHVLGLQPSIVDEIGIGFIGILGMIAAAPYLGQLRPLERVYRLASAR